MLLTDIQTKLQELDGNVYYGAVDNSRKETKWNYIVFDRQKMSVSTNKTGYSYYFSVHIVRENFIPEGFEKTVIDKMLEIDGMRLASSDGIYDYVTKPNTNIVVEMFSVDFVKPIKG